MSRPRIRPEGDERWIYVARRHWMALVIRSLIPLGIGLPVGGLLLRRVLGRQPDFLGREPPLLDTINLILLLIGLIVAVALLYTYLDWANDHLIVSNKRLILEDRTLLLSYAYETLPLNRVQNVNVHAGNFLEHLLQYGRIEVQAAGPTAPIIFSRARCPKQVQAEIMKEVQREKRDQERVRLQAVVRRHLDPAAPPVPVPFVPIEQDIRAAGSRWQAFLPTGPVLEGSAIVWHRHWLVLARAILWPSLALIGWLGLLVLLPQLGLLSATARTLILIIGLLLIGLWFYWQYDNWRNDVYILEPARLIDLSRLPFGLYEDRREAPLGVIQNVNARSPNLIARIFRYGDVMVETAGARGNFAFDHVPSPDQAQRIIFEYVERFKWHSQEREWNSALSIMELYEQARRGGTNRP